MRPRPLVTSVVRKERSCSSLSRVSSLDVKDTSVYRKIVASNRSWDLETSVENANTSQQAWNSVLEHLIRRGMVRDADMLLDDIRDSKSMDVSFSDARRTVNRALERKRRELTRSLSAVNRSQDAIKKFLWALSKGIANTIHLNVTLKMCDDIDTIRALVERAAKRGVGTDNVTFTTVSRKLWMDETLDHHVIEAFFKRMQEKKLIDVPTFFLERNCVPTQEDADIARMTELRRLASSRPEHARKRFKELIRSRKLNSKHLTAVMMTCDDPDDARKLMNEALRDGGMRPSTSMYNVLINAYVVAGQLEIANEEIPREMRRRGVRMDRFTHRALDFSPTSLQRRCAVQLNRLADRGHMVRMEALFEWLLHRKLANVYHLNIMIGALDSSSKSRDLIEGLARRGHKLIANQVTYYILSDQLIKAGRYGEADAMLNLCDPENKDKQTNVLRSKLECAESNTRREVERELSATNITSTSRYLPAHVRLMMINNMEDSLRLGNYQEVTRLFESLAGVCAAETTHLNIALKACDFRGAQRLAREAEEKYGILPDATTFNTLLNTAKRFGHAEDFRRVLRRMEKMKIPRDEHTKKALALKKVDIQKMANTEMRHLQRQGSHESVLVLMHRYLKAGRANTSLLNVALRSCEGREEMKRLIYAAKKHGVYPDKMSSDIVGSNTGVQSNRWHDGCIKFVNFERGYGFIDVDDESSADAYFRVRPSDEAFSWLKKGQRVSFRETLSCDSHISLENQSSKRRTRRVAAELKIDGETLVVTP